MSAARVADRGAGRRAVALGVVAAWCAAAATAQHVTVPVGTPISVELAVPIDAPRAGARFVGAIAADVVVDHMLVAAEGDGCAGTVVAGADGGLTLALAEVRRPRGKLAVAAGRPRFGPDPAPAPAVTGFACALGPAGAGPSRAGKPVAVAAGERLALPGETVIEFALERPWEVPLRNARSVFPQPESAPLPESAGVPSAWFGQADRAGAERARQDQRRAESVRRATGYGIRGFGGGRGFWARPMPHPMPRPDPLQQLTPDQRAALGGGPAVLDAGTKVVARSSAPIDSSLVQPGAPFDAILMTDLVAAGRIVFDRGGRAGGILTVGQRGEELVPTLALTWLQLGGGSIAIQTGPVRILHLPARGAPPAGVGVGSLSGDPPPPPADGALRLPDGTILEFGLAAPVTVR